MLTLIKVGGHYIVGLAIIGAVSALIAVGNVTAGAGLPIITGIAAVLIGGGIKANSTTSTPTVTLKPKT